MKEELIKLKKEQTKNLIGGSIIVLIAPIILTIVFLFQMEKDNLVIMLSILGVIWLFAIIIITTEALRYKKNPYPTTYLVPLDILKEYMNQEEKFSDEEKLEACFHYYIFLTDGKHEVQKWNHNYSNFPDEQQKGSIIYWDKEEYRNIDEIINTKINNIEVPVLIEIIESDNVYLNEYQKQHPELDVKKYIENIINS